ncbi:MAG: glycosyltransferase family 9 protein [Nanoarchaeota archaeon]|nr:glycosyltransferase family 9 protein [DPANN group archaeon]MBL7116653.1 glycosyltransferase family 9 protein [Nanoarchaeota archaeon]
MTLLIDIIRVIDKYFNGLLCLIIGFLSKLFYSKQPKKPTKIAFIKLWAIGDSVTTLPLIKSVKEKYKKTSVIVIAKKRNFSVYKNQKFIDCIVLLEGRNVLKILGLFRKFDLVFDLEPYLNFSALLAWYIGKTRIGFSDQTRSTLYNETSAFPRNKHIVDIYMGLGELVGIKKRITNLLKLKVREKDKKKADSFLKQSYIKKFDLLVGICPGAAESVRERMWPKERFVTLADKIVKKYGAKIVFIGSPKESKLIEQIKNKMTEPSINVAGKLTLEQTFSLIEKCKIFISNDTGPMHIAAAQGCKVIGLFGPNTPKRWAPFGKGNISLYHKTECSPCIVNEKGIMPKCFNREFQKCMKLITVEEVEKHLKK